MRYFYQSDYDPKTGMLQLDEEESRHISKVLRLKIGDEISVLNGKGGIASGPIESIGKHCMVLITDFKQVEADRSQVHLVLAPTKQQERVEWLLEKATEIGLTRISFIQTSHGERARLNLSRLEKKAIAAMKQSKRCYLPLIDDLQSFSSFIQSNPNGVIAHCYPGEKKRLSDCNKLVECPILIGPEGDFSQEELKMATEAGYQAIELGKNRLRTETAALYACIARKISLE